MTKKIILAVLCMAFGGALYAQTEVTDTAKYTNKDVIIIDSHFYHKNDKEMVSNFKDFCNNPSQPHGMTMMMQQKYLQLLAKDGTPWITADTVRCVDPDKVINGREVLRDAVAYRIRQKDKGISAPQAKLKVGDKMPSFTATDVEGNVWDDAALKDRVVVINFWQRACGPCRKEMPHLNTWLEKYRDVVFLSVTWETADVVKPFVERMPFLFHAIAGDKQLSEMLLVNGYPQTVVIGKDRVLVHNVCGTSDEKLQAIEEAIEQARLAK